VLNTIRSKWFLIPAAVLALLIISIALPIHTNVALRSPITVQLSNLKQLKLGLRLYAEDHDGRFPTHLAELLEVPYIPAEISQFHDPTTKTPKDWIYYAGHTLHDSPDTMLLASPVTVEKQKRMVATVHTFGEIIAESEFQKRLKAQFHDE
jgi:hypothetical protein